MQNLIEIGSAVAALRMRKNGFLRGFFVYISVYLSIYLSVLLDAYSFSTGHILARF